MKRIFKRSVWCLLGIFFSILCVIGFVGNSVCRKNDSFVNEFLGIKNYEVVNTDEGEVFNKYPSDYIGSDGNLNDAAMRKNSLDVATRTATEGTVLLSNKDSALPLAKDDKISIFGISSSKYLLSAAGSGHLGVSVTDDFISACSDNGLEVNPNLANVYKLLSSKYGNYLSDSGTTLAGASIGDSCYVEYGINEAPWSQINKTSLGDVSPSFNTYGDAAVMIISRNDGEDGDTNYSDPECLDSCYMDLSTSEAEVLGNLISLRDSGVFKKVILLINSANPMQMKHISQYDLDSLVWVGVGGNTSFQQIAQILSGNANPSGHLIDTYLYDNYSAPSTINQGDFTYAHTDGIPSTQQYSHSDKYLLYSEGIYVGYRYFETRYEDAVLGLGNASSPKGTDTFSAGWDYAKQVAYPFGYGGSYTTFSHSNYSVMKAISGYKVSETITNTGNVSGKDVFSIYLQKPYTDYDKQYQIEKPAVELVGYQKTKDLKPGESQTLSLTIDNESLKSYDSYNKKTYIVEKGDYYLATGSDAHDALNNILSAKGKNITDGMTADGDSNKAQHFYISVDDFTTYSTSSTGYSITNQFDNADPKIYGGLKDSFKDFKYLSRSDWDGTYPTKAVIDCTTDTMKKDLQYSSSVANDPNKSMPVFGKSGTKSLISLYGYDYDDPQWDDLLNQVSWEEAVTLVTYGGGTAGCVSASAPLALAKDGPGGIGAANKNLTTLMAFPCECMMASTFNDDLIEELGNAFGMEILHVGYTGIYGPGANIHRSGYSGRNWEYYSEDPFISGKMLSREVKGLQNRGVIVFTKHFLLNDQERNRYGVSVWANEQSIREIYLKSFETGVREGHMNGIMSSFNRIGAIWSGKHSGLLTEVLRKEWGFVGVVQTDAYVGTHMHQALAESIVAGNDFTMGGSNPTALDSYRNNTVVANALRDCVHRILYTKLYSNAMNGLTLSTKIVYLTPWWETALNCISIISISIAGCCFIMFGLSIILPLIDKRKKHLEQNPLYKDKKIRVFFDVLPKGGVIATTVGVICIVLAAVTIPITVQNYNRNTITGGNSYDSSESISESESESQYSLNTKYEAEDSHTILTPGERGSLAVASEAGSTESYIGGFNANLGAKIKFVLDSPSALDASLSVSVCKRESAQLFTNDVLVMVNGAIMNSKAVVPALGTDDLMWVTFTDVYLGSIQLKEGRNTISFTVINDDVSCGFNFDGIRLGSDAEIPLYEGPYVYDDEDISSLDKTSFPIADNKAVISGTDVIDGLAVFDKADETVTYDIKAEKKGSGILFLDFGYLADDTLSSDIFEVTVNDKEVSYNENVLKASSSSVQYIFATADLSYGDNIISLRSVSDRQVKLSGITIGADQTVGYKDPYEFLTTSDYVNVEGEAYKSAENCIAMNENAMGSIITFQLDSDQPTTADLYISIASRSTPALIKDILLTKVNGTEISTLAALPNEGQDFFTYSDVYISNISLASGYNEITFEVLTNDQSINTNMKSLILKKTTAGITFSASGSTISKSRIQAEDTVITPIEHEGTAYPYVAEGNGSEKDKYLGGINDAGLYSPGNAKISFRFNADSEGFAKLYFNAGVSGSAKASSFAVSVNSTSFASRQSWSGEGWYDWKDLYYGQVKINEGLNTLEITILQNEPMNIDSFALQTSVAISYQ